MADYGRMIPFSQARQSYGYEGEDEQQSLRGGSTPLMDASITPTFNNNDNNSRGGVGGGGEIQSTTSALPTEVLRKPRGRPPGSKNKPKPPIIITKNSESTMQAVVLEIPAAADIIEMVASFASRHQLSLSILSGSGSVSNISLRHVTSSANNTTLTIPGCFEILSLSGTFLLSTSSSSSSSCPSLTISVAGNQGQVLGGSVEGKLMAASTVILMAASFVNPLFYSLPYRGDEEEEVMKDNQLSGNSRTSVPVYSVEPPNPLNCQMPSWAPMSHPPPY